MYRLWCKDTNSLEKEQNKPVTESSYQNGISTLHCWIRIMELILHISYNLHFQEWSVITTENRDMRKIKEGLYAKVI